MGRPPGSTPHAGRSEQTGSENLGPYLNRVIWSLAALSTLFVGLRVYCKLLRRKQLWWDDHVLIASWVPMSPAALPFPSLPSSAQHLD